MTEQTQTRDSLLDAAEHLFSEHGIQAASLRQITQHAGANLAAVNYHFGSKDGLVRAVFSRRLRPMNDERFRLLSEVNLEAEDAVEQILGAFLEPLLRLVAEKPEGVRGFARLMGRAWSEPSEEVRSIILEEIRETIDRFMAAFRKVLPHLSEGELMWRFHFLGGAMGHTVSCSYVLERYAGGKCHTSDPDEALDQLVTFLAAGMRAPSRVRAN
ncbi:MAG TPA: TetR family transcriptional regulator [Thermoanaerobaculia bacterium]|nr:TetR family transcriptional regulator [Thermoanaerobaculia bacterium]